MHLISQRFEIGLSWGVLWVLLVLLSRPALAQPQTQDDSTPVVVLEEVVVTATGTMIRGIAPTGTNVVEMDRESIDILGVTSTNDLLAKVPQVTNYFGTTPIPTVDLGAPINRPNIRQLGASGASTTLVLINSMRLPGAGFQQVSPDPSVIPPAVLERVDVIPDGASSLYGSDAVGGVINFVTRRSFEGVEFTGKYGVSDDYENREASLTAGRKWKGGSGYLSAYWTESDLLLGGDRDWISGDHTARGGDDFRVRTCTPGNISVPSPDDVIPGRINYDMATLQPGENLCDVNDISSTLPGQERRTLFGSINQQLSDRASLGLVAYFSERDVQFAGNTAGLATGVDGRGEITSANPFFTPVGGEDEHNVEFSYAPSLGGAADNRGEYESYNVISELTLDLVNNWQGTFTLNYGATDNSAVTVGIDRVYEAEALVATSTETAINPYDVAATNPAVIDRVTDYAGAIGEGDQEILQLRGIFDGGLFDVAAGEVRLALGLEYSEQDHKVTQGNATRLSNPETTSSKNTRDISSIFGEVFLPVLGASSPVGSLDFSLSGRYDDYNDIGSTSNPKVSFNWLPVDDLTIRGNWGTSFQAPSLADTSTSVDTRAQFIPLSPFRADDSSPLDIARPTILLAGGSDDLEPEEADTWSLGFDWQPAFISGLRASATYYDVDYDNAIVVTPFFQPYFFDIPSLEDVYVTNPTREQAEELLAGLRFDGFTSIDELYANGSSPYLITDARRTNLGNIRTTGVDFEFSRLWSLDSVIAITGVAGNYILDRDSQPVPGSETVDELGEGTINRMNVTLNLGAWYENYSAMLTVYYKDGYDNGTNDVDSFTVANLFLSYDIPVSSWLDGAQVSLNIDNISDENPSYVNDFDGIDTGHSFSVGRMFTLGLRITL